MTFDPRNLLAERSLGVLATIKSSGLPQLSPVTPYYDHAAGVDLVSMTEGRAKTANLRRDPRAAVSVTSEDGRSWATAEGLSPSPVRATIRTDPRSRRWSTTSAAPRARNTRTGTTTAP